MSLPDIIGIIGVVLILAAYSGLTMQRLQATDIAYSLCNAAGAGLVLISLYFKFNLPAALIESAWLMISLYGLYKAVKINENKREA